MISQFSSWILSIVGVVLIIVIVEIILPNGKTAKFIKGILAIFTIFVIVSPVVTFKNTNYLENIFNNNEVVVDGDFLEKINKEKLKEYKNIISKVLSDNGYKNIELNFVAETKKELKINKVYVDISKLVLDKNLKHIDKYTNIVAIIKNIIEIKGEDIIFNEWRKKR